MSVCVYVCVYNYMCIYININIYMTLHIRRFTHYILIKVAISNKNVFNQILEILSMLPQLLRSHYWSGLK